MSEYDKNYYFIKLIEHGLGLIENKDEFADSYFMALSEIPSIDRELASFCTDAMLVAEGDSTGNINNFADLSHAWQILKPNIKYSRTK